ncbi:MAG: hypothetical protein JWM68_5507 [Verrucomicrobiales bacterium]|nr:hypothetical protein [Verrucomicrobiales bacterium]
MNLQELSAHLERECYQPSVYHIGSAWGVCGDTFCIERVGGQFEVFYVERGQRGEAIHRCESESAACDAFLAALDRERFSRAHCVGFFTTKSEADSLSERLVSAGITVHRDAIPYSSTTDMRYRVFVFGRDKIRAQKMIDHAIRPVA